MQTNSVYFLFCLILLGWQIPRHAAGQSYFKIVEESEVYFNQQLARFPNGDLLIGDSFLGPLINGGLNGKVVMTRLDACGNTVWAKSYSLPFGYLEFRDFIISPSDEILVYGSYFQGLEDVFYLLKIDGKTGRNAIFRQYEPETTNGYFAYSLNKIDQQFMVYGFMASPDVGLIAYFDQAYQPLWAKKISPFEPNGAAIISREKSVIARSGHYLFKMNPDGNFEWTQVSNIPAVNGPVEVNFGYILVAHQEGISFFYKIDEAGQLLWQSDEFPAVESSGAITLLNDEELRRLLILFCIHLQIFVVQR